MKNVFLITLLSMLSVCISTNCFAQLPLGSATLDLTLQCAGGSVNRSGIAYNPNQQLYYSVNAGGGSFPIETFSSTGTPMASIASGYSYRGFWWNPNNNTAEGKVIGSGGIVQQNLDGSFYPLGTGNLIVAGSGPDAQSCGDYDWVDDEIVYYFNGSIYRYDRATHTLIASIAVTGLPAPIGNLNTNTATYTNVTGMEIGLYDGINKAFYFINKLTGVYATSCQLPLTAPPGANFQMGFENGYFWIYNTASSQWEGYKSVSTCSNTSNSITETACENYTSPSGNYNWTTSNIYQDTIPNAEGCDSILTIDLTVYSIPNNIIDSTICFGDSIVINGTVYNTDIIGATETFTSVGPFGCDSIVTLNLTVEDLPIVSLVGTGLTGCSPLQVSFDNTSTSTSGLTVCDWDFGDGNFDVGCGVVSNTYTIPGMYDVTLTTTSTSGCVNSATYSSYIAVNECVGIEELNSHTKELIKVYDLMGRETAPRKNQVMIYFYSDGSSERVFEIE